MGQDFVSDTTQHNVTVYKSFP